MSDNQFLVWAERREGRYKSIEGEIMMQAGATRNHERVAKRIFMALASQVAERAFDVNNGDFGVRIKPGSGQGTILYPEVIVDAPSERGDERTTDTPVVVVEVLSRTTNDDHQVEKLGLSAWRDTLRQYIVFEQAAPRAFVWTKSDSGWAAAPKVIEGPEAAVSFPSIGAEVRMAEIYRPVELRRGP